MKKKLLIIFLLSFIILASSLFFALGFYSYWLIKNPSRLSQKIYDATGVLVFFEDVSLAPDLYSPKIELKKVKIFFNHGSIDPEVSLHQLKISLDAPSSFKEKKLFFSISGEYLISNFGNLFRSSLLVNSFKSKATFSKSGSLIKMIWDDVLIETDDLKLKGYSHWEISQEKSISPKVDMDLEILRGNGKNKSVYLPVTIMDRDLVAWLDQGIEQAQITSGKLILKGNLFDFPFDAKNSEQGQFYVKFHVRDGLLNIYPKWPKVHLQESDILISSHHLEALVQKGEFDYIPIKNVGIKIPSFSEKVSRLLVSTILEHDSFNLLDATFNLPPLQKLKKFQILSKDLGSSKVDFKMNLPLSEKQLKNVRVDLAGELEIPKKNIFSFWQMNILGEKIKNKFFYVTNKKMNSQKVIHEKNQIIFNLEGFSGLLDLEKPTFLRFDFSYIDMEKTLKLLDWVETTIKFDPLENKKTSQNEIQVQADQIKIEDLLIKNIVLEMVTEGDDSKFVTLVAQTDNSKFKMKKGRTTRSNESNNSETFISGVVESQSLAKDMNTYFGGNDFDGLKGKTEIDLKWPGEFWDFNPKTVEGRAKIDLKDGIVRGKNSVVGTFLNVLTLNFIQALRGEEKINSVRGQGYIRKGLAETKEFEILFSSNHLHFTGEAEPFDKKINMKVRSNINLSGAVSNVSFGLLNPILNPNQWFTKIIPKPGELINKFMEQTYQVSGSWNEPEVKLVKIMAVPVR